MAENKQKQTGRSRGRHVGDVPPPAQPFEDLPTVRIEDLSDRERLELARRLPTSRPASRLPHSFTTDQLADAASGPPMGSRVDLPRQLTNAAIALETVDHTMLAIPAELQPAAAAVRVAAAVGPRYPTISVVVRGPVPTGLTAADAARAHGHPLAGVLRPEPGLSRALDQGEPPGGAGRGPLAALCRRLLSEVVRPAQAHDGGDAEQRLIAGVAMPCTSGKGGVA